MEDLFERRVFWSWHEPDPASISDEWLVEKVLVYSDLETIYLLFDLYDEAYIRKVWEKRLLPDDRLSSLNILYAFLLFHIDNPEHYILQKADEREFLFFA